MKRSALFIFLYSLFSSLVSQAQPGDSVKPYSESGLLAFADHLYAGQYYKEAAMEYERAWLHNRSQLKASEMMLKAWRATTQYETGMQKALMLMDSIQPLPRNTTLELIALSAWSMKIEQGLNGIYRSKLGPADSLRHMVNLNLIKRDFQQAATLIKASKSLMQIDLTQQEVLLDKGHTLKYKKAWLAAGLSTAIPGSGKVYTGEWKDGLVSFASIALLGFQSYAGFKKDGLNSPLGIISGTLALGFYGANIYGSARSARLYNKKANTNYSEEVRNTFYPAP